MQISFCADLRGEILQKFRGKIKITNRDKFLITIVTASKKYDGVLLFLNVVFGILRISKLKYF